MKPIRHRVAAGILLALCAWSPSGRATAGIVSHAGKTVNVAGASSSLPGVTVGSDPGRLLAVTVGCEFSSQLDEVTGVSFAGEPLTLAIQEAQTISSSSIWYLVNPPTTTGAIEVSFTSDPNGLEASICHYLLSGVDPVTPLAMTKSTGSNVTGTISQTLPGLPDAVIVIDAITTNESTTPLTWGAGQTEAFADGDLGRTATHASSYEAGLSGEQTQSATWTNDNRAIHVSAAFSTPTTVFFTTPDTVALPAGTSGTAHTVAAHDPTGGTVTFTKSGSDAALFTLSPTTGDLAFVTPAASGGTFQLTITATSDGIGGTVPQSLTVIVNDAAPVVTAGSIEVTGDTGTAGAFLAGDTVTVTWDNSPGGDDNNGILDVTVDFSAFGGPAAEPASADTGLWTATFILPTGTIDITDAQVSVTATNVVHSTTTLESAVHVVDTEPPTISATHLLLPVSGASPFSSGDVITMRWSDGGGDENTDTIAGVSFDFSAFGGTTVTGTETGPGSRIWEASHTVSSDNPSSTGLTASATAIDDAGNTTSATSASSVQITTADVIIGPVTGSTNEGDPAAVASYELSLDTTPTGAVEITVTADPDSKVSLDGTSFFNVVTFSRTNTSAQTITVRAATDGDNEGPHLSTISHAITTTADAVNYPASLPINSQSVMVIDDEIDIVQHTAPLTAEPGRLTSTFTHAGPDAPAMIVVGFAAEDSAADTSVTMVEIDIDGVPTELTNRIYAENFDTVGHVGLWYVQLESLPPGTHEVRITTATAADKSGSTVWILPGRPAVRDAATITYRDDENGGPGTGGLAGWVGFNGAETLTRSTGTPDDAIDTEPGDFVLAMAMSGDEGTDYVQDVLGWSAIEQDVLFLSGNYSTLHGPLDETQSMLGININPGYARYGVAALVLELDVVVPVVEPRVVSVGFDGSGNYIVDAFDLDPAKTYILKRGTDLLTYPDQIGTLVTGQTMARFTDTSPPAGFAFYKLEEITTPPVPVDPTLVLTGVSPGGAMLFEANNLDPAKTYVLKRGTDLLTFPDQIGNPVTGVTLAFFTDPTPPTGTALYQLEEYAPTAGDPTLTMTGPGPGGSMLFEARGLDPAKTYLLKRGTDLLTFPDTIGASVTGQTLAVLSDPSPPPAGNAFYQLWTP